MWWSDRSEKRIRKQQTQWKQKWMYFWFWSNNAFDGIVKKKKCNAMPERREYWMRSSRHDDQTTITFCFFLFLSSAVTTVAVHLLRLVSPWQYAYDDNDSELCAVRAQTEFHEETTFRVKFQHSTKSSSSNTKNRQNKTIHVNKVQWLLNFKHIFVRFSQLKTRWPLLSKTNFRNNRLFRCFCLADKY